MAFSLDKIKIASDLLQQGGVSFFCNHNLAPYVAYGVGGPADIVAFPENRDQARIALAACKQTEMACVVIGEGTNLLVSDSGLRGMALLTCRGFRELYPDPTATLERPRIWVGAGLKKSEVLDFAIEQGLSGLEFSSGVPGTVGGGIYMNAGTKYGCYADIIHTVWGFELGKATSPQFGVDWIKPKSELRFDYRHSSLTNCWITGVTLELVPSDKTLIQSRVETILAERQQKQPLDKPSCGSTFKNPPDSLLPAGRLIEQAGLKGMRQGGAVISPKHANFILNLGGATALDIYELLCRAQQRVREKFGIQLEPEVQLVGNFACQKGG